MWGKLRNAAQAADYRFQASVGGKHFMVTQLVAEIARSYYELIALDNQLEVLNRNIKIRAGIEAEYRSANARQLQAVFNYERTLLQAFTDVANQLVKFENLQKSYELEAQQVQTLTESVEVSNVLFQSARADYMEVLLTRRDSLDAELELIETKKRLLQSMVNIYQALGGGWRPAS